MQGQNEIQSGEDVEMNEKELEKIKQIKPSLRTTEEKKQFNALRMRLYRSKQSKEKRRQTQRNAKKERRQRHKETETLRHRDIKKQRHRDIDIET